MRVSEREALHWTNESVARIFQQFSYYQSTLLIPTSQTCHALHNHSKQKVKKLQWYTVLYCSCGLNLQVESERYAFDLISIGNWREGGFNIFN